VNPLDLIAILLVVVALILGARSGAIPQVGGLLGAIAGGALVISLLPVLAHPLEEVDPTSAHGSAWRPDRRGRPGRVDGGGGRAMGWVGSGLLSRRSNAGATLGAVQALLIVWLTGGLLAQGPLPRFAEAAGTSTVVRTMSTVLPPPTELAVELRTWLDASGLPDVFIGFEPLPAPPVQRPGDAAAEAIAAGAVASTVKIAAATCGLSSLGTGFVVRADYV
jgi:hypothetical protein